MAKKKTGIQREMKRLAASVRQTLKELRSMRTEAIKIHREGRWEELAGEAGMHPEILVNLFYGVGLDSQKPSYSRYFKTVIQNRPLERICNCAYKDEPVTNFDDD